jgi:DinB superfamily
MPAMNAPLDLREIARVLQTTPNVLRHFVTQLPDRATAWHPGPGRWCIREVVGHLTEEDKRDFVGRIQVMLEHDEPRLAINDQDAVARMRHDCAKRIDFLLDEFSSVRSESVEFVLSLKKAELHRAGVHPRIDRIRVVELLHEWIYHDLNHIKQISANVQHFLWAHLGNMKRFYEPWDRSSPDLAASQPGMKGLA